MMEPLLGSPSPVWTGLPATGFSWYAAPTPLGGRSIGPSANAGMSAPQFTHEPEGALSVVSTPFGALGVSGLVGPGFSTAVPATALLATVAVRRGQPQGPVTDAEIEEFLYDALDLLAGSSDVEVRSEGGRLTVTGTVPHKRLKRDVGEIAWAIPRINDVQNNLTITARRRSRPAGREVESPQGGRKPA